jgi:hypothetical protein
MAKKMKKSKRPKDVNQLAHQLVETSTRMLGAPNYTSLSEYMSAMGRKGGKIGGKRRLETMTDKERSILASNAAKVRWQKKRRNS